MATRVPTTTPQCDHTTSQINAPTLAPDEYDKHANTNPGANAGVIEHNSEPADTGANTNKSNEEHAIKHARDVATHNAITHPTNASY